MTITAPLAGAALIFLLAAARLDAAPATARALPRLMPAPESALMHAAQIGLSAEQRAKLEGDVREMEVAAQKLAEQTRTESDALAQVLAADKPDDAAVTAQFEKVLATEAELKRVRLKMSLRTRAVLTPEQQRQLASLSSRGTNPRGSASEQTDLAVKMQRMKELIERAKQSGRDLSSTRQIWNRVGELTKAGRTNEAARLLDEAARDLEAALAAPQTNR